MALLFSGRLVQIFDSIFTNLHFWYICGTNYFSSLSIGKFVLLSHEFIHRIYNVCLCVNILLYVQYVLPHI